MFINFALFYIIPSSVSLSSDSILHKEVFGYHNESNFKANFAYEVVDKINKSFQQWFFTIIFCEFTYFENRILKYTETVDFGYPVLLLDGCPAHNRLKVKPKIDKHGQPSYLITSNKLSTDFSEFTIEALLRTGVFKPRNAVIFVINTPVEINSYFYFEMRTHFQLLWSRGIPNSVLVLWSNKLKMYAYNPFLKMIREIMDSEDVNMLITNQYYNLYGHEIKASVFRKIYLDNSTSPVTCDVNLVATVIKHLNATCKAFLPRDGNTIGDLFSNGTATGITADLIEAYTDMELSTRILRNSYYGWLDTTYPLVQDELCFLVRKAGKQSTFKTTLKLISLNILILLLCNVVLLIAVSVIVLKLESRIWNFPDHRSSTEIILDIFKCLIRQTVDIKFIGPIFRIVVSMIMLYSLVTNCAIDGILTSAITYPRYKADWNTLDDLAATNLKIGVHHRNMKIFTESLSLKYHKIFKNRIESLNDEQIKKIIEEKEYKYALVLLKSESRILSRKPENMVNGRPLLHTTLECAVPCWIVHAQRYGSPYIVKINSILSSMHQAGIPQHLLEKGDVYTKKTYIDVEENQEKRPLKAENLQEVFFVLLIGMAFSAVLLIFEIVTKFVANLFIV